MLHCPYCKGRHDPQQCPFYLKALTLTRMKTTHFTENFQSNSPAPFVGQYGYPHVNVGILAPPQRTEDVWQYDAPKYWAAQSYQIPQIVGYRTGLVNLQESVNIKQANKIIEISQYVAMADKPVELEVNLKQKPVSRVNFDAHNAPTGPIAQLKKAQITANPSIPTKVDKVVNDVDLKAAEAITYLYKHSFDENFLTRLLSVGTLGVKTNRKLVPTKWSITATDDMLGKHLLKTVRDKSIANYCAYFGSYLGNYYMILFFPDVWSYELFEIYLPTVRQIGMLDYSTDYETFDGRKEYAADTTGGYYTVRLAILEKLIQMKRQASALVIRVITDEYTLPLGVWVTREATRKTLAKNRITFTDDKLMINYATTLLKNKFGLDITRIIKESKLLNTAKQQKKLNTFLTT